MCFAQFQVWKSSKSNVRLTRSAKVEGGTKNGFGSLGNWRSLIPWPWPQSSPLHSILLRNSLSFAVILVFNKPTSSFNFYIHTFTRAQVQEFRTWILLLIIWFVFLYQFSLPDNFVGALISSMRRTNLIQSSIIVLVFLFLRKRLT